MLDRRRESKANQYMFEVNSQNAWYLDDTSFSRSMADVNSNIHGLYVGDFIVLYIAGQHSHASGYVAAKFFGTAKYTKSKR